MESSKRVHVIACGVLGLDIRAAAERTGLDVSMEFLPGGLHSTPSELRLQLQQAIDAASADQAGDMIAVGYGVCGLGTVGIAARNIPLAIPRVHDCIALFLGSDSAYRTQFSRFPGTYYISAGWVAEKSAPQMRADSKGDGPPDADFQELIDKHGQDNADAIQYFLSSWQRNYQRAAFIDTGVDGKERYERIARTMAKEFGWSYELLTGAPYLIERLLKQRFTSDEILIVPPHHVTAYDPMLRTLKAVPVWADDGHDPNHRRTVVFEGAADEAARQRPLRLGLGIDAGGTYTDAVIFNFTDDRVVAKAKALTTKWDYTVGIDEALDKLDAEAMRSVDMVSVSTTLATNAIVEGRGQKVGLLVMPPYGLFDAADVTHRPVAVIGGGLEIDGAERDPVDPDDVRRAVAEMIDVQKVGAFAVAGFASHVNPAHELAVKQIIREETGRHVTCGHEVSGTLNYRIRAATAALNARIIPCLEALLEQVDASLGRRGVTAPRMVVRSDGSLMNVATARERPIETILSGPAASVAGARHLAAIDDALVVDIGGTTTDTAVVAGGQVRTCAEGASVGGWRTHVQALDMCTLGLGGDSLVALKRMAMTVGPRRVGPVCWLAEREPDTIAAIEWTQRHMDHYQTSSGGMDLFVRCAKHDVLDADDDEKRVLDALADGPLSAHELAQRVGKMRWEFLSLNRLEETHTIQRCGPTPTDMLHVTGQLSMWDVQAARRTAELFGQLLGVDRDEFAERVIERFGHMLTVELLKKQLSDQMDGDELDSSPAARVLVENLLAGGSNGCRVRVKLDRPVVGIGAPVHFFLPGAAKILETAPIVPPHADVANAVGAITSSVTVHRHAEISPNEVGRYKIEGLVNAPTFAELEEAYDHAVAELCRLVREAALHAGTSEETVELIVDDRVAAIADGSQMFIGRRLEATLTGRPDIRLAVGV